MERPDVLTPLRERELYDPLSEVTRTERKYLLLVSLVCLALTWSDLLPTKVDALGIEISTSDRFNLVLLLGLTLLYFIAAFVTYAAADRAQWRVVSNLAQRRTSEAVQPIADMAKEDLSAEDMERLNLFSHVSADIALGRSAMRYIDVRAWFDFAVPLAVAAVALISVVAEVSGFDDPFTLASFAWSASPLGTKLVLIGVLALLWSVVRRHRRPQFKLPLRMRLGHRIWKLGKLFPFSKSLQQKILFWGLSVHQGREASVAGPPENKDEA